MNDQIPQENRIDISRANVEIAKTNGRVDVAFAQISALSDLLSSTIKHYEKQREDDKQELREHREEEKKIWKEVTDKLSAGDTTAKVFYAKIDPIYKLVLRIISQVAMIIVSSIMTYLYFNNTK